MGCKMKRVARGGLIVLLILLVVLPFLLVPIPPMTDFCQHVMVAHVLNHYRDTDLNYAKYFEVGYSAAPTMLAYVWLSFLQRMSGPFAGGKIYLVFFVLALWVSERFYLRKLKIEDPSIIALASLPLAFSGCVYMGFLPFIMTLPLYTFLLGWWISRPSSFRRSAVGGIILIVTYGFHVIGAIVGAFSIICLSILSGAREKGLWRKLLKDVAALCPLLILLAIYFELGKGPKVSVAYEDLWLTMKTFAGHTFGSLADSVLWIGILGFGGFCIGAFYVILKKRHISSVLILSLSLCLVGLLMPYSLGSLFPAGPRVFPYAILSGIGLLNLQKFGRRTFIVVICVVMVLMSFITINKSREVNKEYEQILSGVSKIEYGKKLLPIVIEPYKGSRHTYPFLWITVAYNIIRGGSQPYIFASPYIKTNATPLEFRSYDAYGYAFLDKDPVQAEDYRGVSGNYDYVLIWGEDPRIQSVISAEMRLVYLNSPLKIYGRK
jgi:hypothetical protein